MTDRDHNLPYWMIRKVDMRIFRPVSQAELVAKIEAGEVAPNDEICPSGGYWFMLSDVNEVRQHLGNIKLSCLQIGDEEATSSTDTHTSQKTSIISTAAVETVRREYRKPEKVHQSASEVRTNRRLRNAIGAGVGLVAFILFLVWIWSGTY